MAHTPFDAKTVELQQANLIEASAGTGKTYSIAILCLRLLLEKNMAISQILMVTFTKAAVAELETRIRAFVLLAHQASIGQSIGDETIAEIVSTSINNFGDSETEARLKNALLFLDETAILTIHSFCQGTLSEYAFETNQIFGAEAMSQVDLNELTVDRVNHFWRNHITQLELPLLKYLFPNYLKKDTLQEFIQNALSGKTLLALAPFEPDLLSVDHQKEMVAHLFNLQKNIEQALQNVYDYIIQHEDELRVKVEKDRYAKKEFPAILNDPPVLVALIQKRIGSDYVLIIFKEVIELMNLVAVERNTLKEQLHLFSNKLYRLAIKTICGEVQDFKEAESLLAFDDMIGKLHKAVAVQQNPALIAALRNKYKAVFIDEFQDTDKLQYEVFNTLFGTDTVLFYIGDPKQSIYGWRKADILTYFKAGNAVDNRYGMNTNFRSSDGIIGAQNSFFKPDADFDTFHFGDAEDAIHYHAVSAPENNEKGELLYDGLPVAPMSVCENNNNDEIIATVQATVVQLLSDAHFTIVENNGPRPIKPSDIGIIVRKKDQSKKVRAAMAAFKIPAVTIDDTKLSDTIEATEMLYVLSAVQDITANNINKALLSGLTGLLIADIQQLNEELVLTQFKRYQLTWTVEGVYVMLMQFLTDYKVKTVLLNAETKSGERSLSNVLQLIELFHNVQARNQYAPKELIHWLQKLIEGKITQGDEYEQRVESDADAVKIITIHSCKGLEYNIVLAPFLDLDTKVHGDFASFRDDASGEYLFANKAILNDDQTALITTQLEQENRRLLYVAITRAKYKCYLNNSLAAYYKDSCLKPFIAAIKASAPAAIAFETPPPSPVDYSYDQNQKRFPIDYKKAAGFKLTQLNWRKLSYTFLNPEHTPNPITVTGEVGDAYDDFIFKQLQKGAYTGNLLHYIFECMDFSDNTHWPKLIDSALKRLSPGNQEAYAEQLQQLLVHVTQTPLVCGEQTFNLAAIDTEHCLNEFEFDFTVEPFYCKQISALSTPTVPLRVQSDAQLEGIMNGKMDLFFEQGGKYYILDWKSNFLGDRIADYSAEQVAAAMADNNYHLQYHIYTVAICKYLALRIPDFDYATHFGGVIYLFVRGVRQDATTGIFFNKPEWATIEALDGFLTEEMEPEIL